MGDDTVIDPATRPSAPARPAANQLGRRHVAQKIKSARAQLTSQTGIGPELDIELLRTYASHQLSVGLAIPLPAIVFAATASLWAPALHTAYWLCAVLAGNAAMLLAARRFLNEQGINTVNAVKTWANRFNLLEALNGFLFATVVLLDRDNGDQLHVLIFAAVLVFIAMRTVLSNNNPETVLAATLPVSLSATVIFVVDGDVLGRVMGGFVLGVQAFFTYLSYSLYDSSKALLRLRAEKDALIGELEQARSISDEARRRAEQANTAKSRFLATMSHELRTPLNAILGFSEVMKDEILGQHQVAAYKEYSADIHHSGDHLLRLINEILDLSRIEAGRYELNEEPVSLVNTVAECHHLLKLRARERGVTIAEDMAADMSKLWADERAVRQIVLNLLTNAVKFTPNGGTVTITVGWTKAGGQYLSVRDTGPGIPENEIPIIKQSFGRGSQALKDAEEGTGLGLPIVISLVELHGGRFDLQSTLRVGTTVTVLFPRERVMTTLPPLSEDDAA